MTQLNSSTTNTAPTDSSPGRILSSISWRYLRFVFAIVLISSAVMKWRAFGGHMASPLFEIVPQLEWLLIQFELLLAVWLLIGWLPLMAWGTTLVLFNSFAGASLMMVIQGRSTCGCLGDH